MPVVAFKPTKARLVIDQQKDTVLVMKLACAGDESLRLADGTPLSSRQGVLRIREHKPHLDRLERRTSGTITWVKEAGGGRYQINVAMTAKKFEALLEVALSGALPHRLFIEAGDRVGPLGSRGIGYEFHNGARRKVWNHRARPVLPITGFTVILPIQLEDAPDPAAAAANGFPGADPNASLNNFAMTGIPGDGAATSAQVAELADELLAFQAETHYTLKAIVVIIGVILLLAVVFNIALLYR